MEIKTVMSPLSRWLRFKRLFQIRAPKYTTNFIKTPLGNGIKYGNELIIRVRGAEVVTGRVYDSHTNKTFQIDQSHTNDEDKDAETTNFTLKSRLHPDAVAPNYYLPPGKYVLLTWWWDNNTMRGGTYRDKFVIIH